MMTARETSPALHRAVLLILAIVALSRPLAAEVRGGFRVAPSDPPGGISPFGIVGWAVSSCGRPEVRVLLDGKPHSILVPIYRLPEIRKRFPDYPGSDSAGFWTAIDPARLSPGAHVFEIRLAEPSCGEKELGRIRLTARAPISPAVAVPALMLLLVVAPFVLAGLLVREPSGRSLRIPLLPVSAVALAGLAVTIVLSGKYGEPLFARKAGLFSPLGNWDGEHYLNIAAHGYGGPGGENDWGWFPLFPTLLRLLSVVPLPLPLLGSVFNLCCILSAVVVLRRHYPADTEGIFFFILFPTSLFFVACYAESSFVLFSVGALAAVRKGRPVSAAILGGLAALTRPIGFLVGLFALEFLRARRWRDFFVTAAGPIAGLFFWRFVPTRWTGDATKYFQIQRGFGPSLALRPGRILDVLLTPIAHPLAGDLPELLALLLVLVGAAALLRRGRVAEGLFSASVVLLPFSAGVLSSMVRYALAAFPALVLLGNSLRNRALLYALWALEGGLALLLAERFGTYWFVG